MRSWAEILDYLEMHLDWNLTGEGWYRTIKYLLEAEGRLNE